MDEELEVLEADEVAEEPVVEDQVEGDEPEAGTDEGDKESPEVTVSIGDEPIEEADENEAKPWVRELRKKNREDVQRIRELEAENQKLKAKPADAEPLGAKPKLADFDYDTERFEAKLTEWHDRKRAADDAEAKKRAAADKAKAEWDAQLARHSKLKSELKVADLDEAEIAVETGLSQVQRGLIVHGADNSALVTYALGKNPKKLSELAAITDPVKFAFAVAKLETQLKVTPRKAAPVPERQVRGSAPVTGAVDSQLERLRAEADRTGDRSKVIKYMADQTAKGRK